MSQEDHAKTIILVAEDDPNTRSILIEDIRKLGFQGQFFEAENGLDALKIFQANENIGLVITDVYMPEMNGFELVDKIRAHSSRSATPILVLTADNALGTINKLAKSGADNFIVKPWNRQLLVQKMLYCLEGRKD